MLQRYKIHHFTSPVLIFKSNQGQQYDMNPFTPICFFTHTQIYIFLYEFASLSFHFFGLLQDEFISQYTYCFAICSFHLINYGHPWRSVCIVQIFFPLGAVGYSKPWILHIWSNHILIDRHSVFCNFSQRLSKRVNLKQFNCENTFWSQV